MLRTDDTRTKLTEAEQKLRELRAERQRATTIRDATLAAIPPDGGENDAAISAAEQAAEAVRNVEARIGAVTDEQTDLLRRLGDAEAGRAGYASPGVDGWEVAAEGLNLNAGELRVEVAAATLLRPTVPGPSSASAYLPPAPPANPGTVPVPVSNRWLYPVFAAAPFGGGGGDLVATDFTISFTSSALTGVEIDPVTDTEKAKMPATVGLATPTAKTFAVYSDDVPSKLFDSQDAVRAFLSVEMDRRLSEAFDSHVVGKIEGANPPNGNTGANLIEKIRRGIAAMRDRGGDPTVVALTPEAAADLDLSTDLGGERYVFIPGTDSQSNVWRLAVRESPSVTDPILIDVRQLGLSYIGEGSVLVDPYSSMTSNQVRVRTEIEAVYHVRNASQGAYVIG